MLFALGLLLLATPLAPLPPHEANIPWPTKNWATGALPVGVNSDALDEALQVVSRDDPVLGETRAVVLVHRGQIVAERYRPGYGPETRLISWSMAKSITHALVGIATRLGKVDPDKPMGNPRWVPGDPRGMIPWRQWLQMVDGQEYREIGIVNHANNDAARMLFGEGRRDVAEFAAGLPLIHRPGEHWNYNSAGINLISDALTRVLAPQARTPKERRSAMLAFIHHELFEPLGMSSAQPQFDRSGTFLGSAMVYATARDFARFGLLYLRDGVWDGVRILPEGWVDFARTSAEGSDANIYGAGFWLAPAQPKAPRYVPGIAGPNDAFQARGFEGQVISIVPSKNLVLVRLGHMREENWPALLRWVAKVESLFPDL